MPFDTPTTEARSGPRPVTAEKRAAACAKSTKWRRARGVQPRTPDTLEARFWARVSKTEGCWIWTGGRWSSGYGRLVLGGLKRRSHRLSYELHHGSVPAGKVVCHRCDNRLCVNPSHLFLGTTQENTADMVAKGRQAKGRRCPGAKLTEEAVKEIRARFDAGETGKDLGEAFGVSGTAIRKVLSGRSWGHV